MLGRVILAAVIAVPLIYGASTAVLKAQDRAFQKGREVGTCDMVVRLDAAQRKSDPTWKAPGTIVPKCKALIAASEQEIR